jgi:hypothetical protein
MPPGIATGVLVSNLYVAVIVNVSPLGSEKYDDK